MSLFFLLLRIELFDLTLQRIWHASRDLGPRLCGVLYGLIKGYDISGIFGNGQWLMYIIAPIIGGILGGLFHYKVVVKLLPDKDEVR